MEGMWCHIFEFIQTQGNASKVRAKLVDTNIGKDTGKLTRPIQKYATSGHKTVLSYALAFHSLNPIKSFTVVTSLYITAYASWLPRAG